MNRSVIVLLLLFVPSACFAKKKPIPPSRPPQMTVQLYAQYVSDAWPTEVVDVYLVLPDKSHAVGHCLVMMTGGGKPCLIESFAPEKRVVQDCISLDEKIQVTCLSDEMYYADRIGNYITIYAANGLVTYHITGSWTDFKPGTRRRQ